MRKVFFSFDWDDVWQANQVRNSWVTKRFHERGFRDMADIEKAKKQTDKAIRQWIDEQMEGTSVTCILIGKNTSKSKWVKYEIEKSHERSNGLLGIYIHDLQGKDGKTSRKGQNPLENYNDEIGFGDKVKNVLNVLCGGAVGLVLARVLFSPLTVYLAGGVALALLNSEHGKYAVYDWTEDNGYNKIGHWVEKAAKQVGR